MITSLTGSRSPCQLTARVLNLIIHSMEKRTFDNVIFSVDQNTTFPCNVTNVHRELRVCRIDRGCRR